MYLIYGLSPRLQSVSGVSKEETPPGSSGTETPRPVMLRSSRAAVLVVTALHAGRRSLCRADAQSSGGEVSLTFSFFRVYTWCYTLPRSSKFHHYIETVDRSMT